MNEKKITDEILVAYIDGELSSSEIKAVEDYLAGSNEARQKVEDLKKVNIIIKNIADEIVTEPLPDSISALIQKKKTEEDRAYINQNTKEERKSVIESIQSLFKPLMSPVPQMAMIATSLLLGVYIGFNGLQSNDFNLQPGNYEIMVTRGSSSQEKLIPILKIILDERRQTSSILEGDREYIVKLSGEFISSGSSQCLVGEIINIGIRNSNFFIGCLNDNNAWDITFTSPE